MTATAQREEMGKEPHGAAQSTPDHCISKSRWWQRQEELTVGIAGFPGKSLAVAGSRKAGGECYKVWRLLSGPSEEKVTIRGKMMSRKPQHHWWMVCPKCPSRICFCLGHGTQGWWQLTLLMRRKGLFVLHPSPSFSFHSCIIQSVYYFCDT